MRTKSDDIHIFENTVRRLITLCVNYYLKKLEDEVSALLGSNEHSKQNLVGQWSIWIEFMVRRGDSSFRGDKIKLRKATVALVCYMTLP